MNEKGQGDGDALRLPKAVWMERFGRRLMQLRPSMNSITAATHSVEAYRSESDSVPEEAAEKLARLQYP
jgi:hypothetical protein